MRDYVRLLLLVALGLAPTLAQAQDPVVNPCETSIEVVTVNPPSLYFKSTPANFGLVQVQNLNIRIVTVQDGVQAQQLNLPKYKATMIPGLPADAEGKRCYQVPVASTGLVFSAALVRDGVTQYRSFTQFDNSNDALDSDWSEGSNPFVLPAPVVPKPAAPTAVRMG